ncbi:phage tail tape measure protein [Clostridium botulinum]|uniref:phage tail tape measure protein n=1 Tax=Clostridium botulinum TaxID=1491 RepID=UPI000774A178|nr:phage tail tape measure protein [Clostridium botulinum]MBN3405739.1 phage tail tape measure protein [Clostridium botulinum]NEZ83808.1 phage tail tape measure protein [Clostridium botulinum]NFA06949.1 phage tail tape measure protein [Clostridium botulinum]NFA25871.1 phage tail tape measure protein [Clostridium botulinum]NFB80806.1 phage tail tape measure protein [Clostridium botulinum]
MAEDVGSLVVRVAMENSDFERGIQNLNRSMRLIQSEFKNATVGLKDHGQGLDGLKSKQEMLSKTIELQTEKVAKYRTKVKESEETLNDNIKVHTKLKENVDNAKKAWEDSEKSLGKNAEETKKLKSEYEKLDKQYADNEEKIRNNVRAIDNWNVKTNSAEAKLKDLKNSLSSTSKEIDKQSNKWVQASNKLKNNSEKFENTGKKITDVGKGISKLSLPIAAVGIGSAKAAIDFESAFAGVKKTVDGTKEQFANLEKGIRSTSKVMPQSATEIAGVAEAAGQLGIKTDNILGFTKSMVMLGDSTNMSSETAATALARFANITQMSQKDFSKLGSVIVHLGNNLATTESEIVEMGLRLAGAGKQIGLTEGQILGLSGAFSSVGIEAEMGGSAISKVMVKMQAAATIGSDKAKELEKSTGMTIRQLELMASNQGKAFKEVADSLNMTTGEMNSIIKSSKELDNFGKIAGMTGEQFKQAFEKDAATALIAFIKGLGNAENVGSSAIEMLEEMGIKEVRLRDSLLRAANAGTLLEDSINMGTKAWGENVALTNEANQRYETTESKLKMAKNQITDAGITIGKNLLPAIRDIAVSVAGMTEKFSNLSPEMQKGIVKFGAFVAITGPAIVGVGKLATGFGSILSAGSKVAGIMGKVSLATKGAEAATTTASVATGLAGKGITAMGLAAKAGALLLNPWVLGIGAATVAGVALYKHLQKDAVPSIDLFATKTEQTVQRVKAANGQMVTVYGQTTTKISEGTKKSVGAYMELDKKASGSLTNLVANSDKFTKQAKDKVIKNFTDMSKKSSKLSNEQKNTMTTNFKKLVTDTGVLTKKNKDEIIKQYTAMVNGTKGLTKKHKDQTIKEFADTLNKSTAITKQQSSDLQKIYKDMGDKIKVGLDKKKTDELKSQQEFFSKSNVLTTTEEAKILQTTATSWENKKKTINGLQNQINSIIQNAANHHKQLTEDEVKTIDSLQQQMKENAVKTLSASEVEQKVIMERLKSYNGRITAEQASEVIKNAEKQKQSTIDKANQQYDGTVKNIIKLRDESKVISAATADKMIKEAERQRKESIDKAENQKKEVVKKITSMNKDIGESVDTTSGNMLTTWDKLKKWWDGWKPDSKQFSYTLRGSEREAVQKKEGGKAYATGTTNATRGWNLVGEEGPELLWFDGGETVLNNRDTLNLFNKLDNKIGYATSREWGVNLSQGLADGINNSRKLVHDSILETANGINLKTRKTLGINSPSRVMQELGKFSSEGLALGILENKDKVESAVNLAAQVIKDVTENKLDDIQVKVNTNDKEIKDRVTRQLNWGVYNKDEYQKYLNFVDKLNKEEVEKSKEFLKEDYENRVKNVEDRLRVLKNENSIELQTERARVDQEIAHYQNLQRNTKDKNAKKNYANQIASLRQYQKQVLNTTKANQKAQVDSLERSKRALKEYYDDGIKLLDKREKEVKKSLKIEENAFKDLMITYDTAIKSLKVKTGDLVKDLKNQEAIVVVQSKKVEDLRKRYEDLAYTLGIAAEETVKAREEFENARVELENMANAVKDAAKNLSDYIDKFKQDIANALKERYEDELKLQEESINSQIQNLEKWKDESIKRIDDVYDAKIKAIEEQLEEEDKADKDAEEMKKINSLKSAIDFEHNEFNKAEMQQELNNLLKEREKRLHREQLEEQKKKLEKEKEDKLQNINSIYESNKKSLEKQLEDYRAFCEKRTQDAVLQAQAEKMIMDNNQKEIVELLHSYSKEYEYAGQTLGQKLVDGFSPKIQEIKDMIASITAEINGARQNALDLSRSVSSVTTNSSVTNNRNNTFNVYASNNNGGSRSIESELRSLTFSMA